MCIFDHPDFLMINQQVDATTKQCWICYVYCSLNYTWPTHLEQNTRNQNIAKLPIQSFWRKKTRIKSGIHVNEANTDKNKNLNTVDRDMG